MYPSGKVQPTLDPHTQAWLVRMEWRPAGWSVCLPLLIFAVTFGTARRLEQIDILIIDTLTHHWYTYIWHSVEADGHPAQSHHH